MFILYQRHQDWYEDGIEDGEQCWRMDLNRHIQVQLFARPVSGNATWYESVKLFIERDTRDKSNQDRRIYYACKTYPLDDATAILLLTHDKEDVSEFLAEKFEEVMSLPNMPEYCDE